MHINLQLISCSMLGLLMSCSQPHYQLIIENGTIYDGTGNQPIQSDIGINNERIADIGDLSKAQADNRIDATSMAIAPGFIDMHAHLDPILEMPDAESHVRQGVTLALGRS